MLERGHACCPGLAVAQAVGASFLSLFFLKNGVTGARSDARRGFKDAAILFTVALTAWLPEMSYIMQDLQTPQSAKYF